jgi:phenylacetate-coenzyme A ligase PaaK-like adenylate-forming protein
MGVSSFGRDGSQNVRALRNHITHVKELSPFTGSVRCIEPGDIKTIEDFQRITFTKKNILQGIISIFRPASAKK